jgi:hypothetical protein
VGSAPALAKVFRRIGGCAEWSVRLSCSPSPAVEAEAKRGRTRARATRESGTSFLHRKKTGRDQARSAGIAARGAVELVFRRLDAIAKDSVRKQSDMPGSNLVLDAAFLVPHRRQGTFEREVARLASATARAGCDLVLSGPWPAYHFVGRN